MIEQPSGDPTPLARQVVARDSVRALTWIGVLALVYSAVNALVPPVTATVILVGDVILGAAFILGGLVLTRRRTAPSRVAWVFAAAMTTEIVWGMWVYTGNPTPVHLLYVTILMTAFGPLTAAWRPFGAAAAVMLAGVSVAMVHVGGKGVASLIIGMSAGLAVGAVLLRIRIRSLRELERTEQALVEVSTRDHLTGLLNRHGLLDRVPALWADARRRSLPVAVYFLDVRGLKHVNDAHGHDLGDIVLKDVARAVTDTVRGSDVVARWGGDEFVIVSVGETASSGAFATRLNEAFTAVSQVRHDDKVGEISVGRAVGSPIDVDFDVMLREADTDMYARRELDATA